MTAENVNTSQKLAEEKRTVAADRDSNWCNDDHPRLPPPVDLYSNRRSTNSAKSKMHRQIRTPKATMMTTELQRTWSEISDGQTTQRGYCNIPKEADEGQVDLSNNDQNDQANVKLNENLDEDNEFSTDSEGDHFCGAKEIENGKPAKLRTAADSLKNLAKEASSMYQAVKRMANPTVQRKVKRDYVVISHPEPDPVHAELNANLEASWTPPYAKQRQRAAEIVAGRRKSEECDNSD